MGLLRDIGVALGLVSPDGEVVEEPLPEDEEFGILESFDFRQKFVSGLFYCGGEKRQFFAQTFEQNNEDREPELLDRLEESFQNCSDIRENFGYSDDFVARDVIGAQYPEIEVGEL